MSIEKEEVSGFIKFYGPLADNGSVDIENVGKSLVALNRFLNKYQKDTQGSHPRERYILKISGVNKNCTELVLSLQQIAGDVSFLTNVALFSIAAEKWGITEFSKSFFSTLGNQLALSTFAKGKQLIEKRAKFKETEKGQEPIVLVANHNGEEKEISAEDWENYRKFNPYTSGIVQLSKGKEEEMSVGFYDKGKPQEVARIPYTDMEYFNNFTGLDLGTRSSEPFDEEKAKEVRITGQFVDFYGLAQKYFFSFQARKEQEIFGKQKILCIVPQEKISIYLDYLKPENKKNVTIRGMATEDFEGKVDKIKIEWISEDRDYNPKQFSLLK